ncbi:hypothetical protein TBLA_0D01670 [Henningerozyma blattae CBS 6284]|uniref:Zn(2)-C6 fungal-type domain-containing protein n=1 Tax=Henningerozyma blattae (strain ATCC 34711 / CBS 6284 / DSM 70876 / NBRC 10599 / NRRL Y-10934 / UCD 77-7) TaxID=1071380 RepID=I2H2S3_HENB6|nr:hypothetical protein TBLA_0D01670 [Tetrapisispora blattae CBS 6284]CCH60675.1 hypothetical protein TBLA_0D01670 [Tetrapisispora blattae CBS 6284]
MFLKELRLSKRMSDKKSKGKSVRWRRSYKACINCRLKKVKCDLGPLENPHSPPCVRCKREARDCIFDEPLKKLGTVENENDSIDDNQRVPNSPEDEIQQNTDIIQERISSIVATNESRFNNDISNSQKHERKDKPSERKSNLKVNFTNMRNALEFLANAAGQAAEERLSEEEEELNNKFEKELNDDHISIDSPATQSTTSTDSVKHLDLSDESIASLFLSENETNRKKVTSLIEAVIAARPISNRKLTDYDYIGKSKMISEFEAIQLINAFFLTMHPFYPYLPDQLQDPHELARYPILLCTILTISSRHHKFNELGTYNGVNDKRHIDVHEKLWVYCQKMISQTVWAEASTRSLGTVLAFLLFTEWNPRAIHWKWADYANNPKLNDFSTSDTGINDYLKVGKRTTGLGAIRRSDRMAWMLCGTSVRIAQDMGFIENSSNVFVATHTSETFHAMNVGQRSSLNESLNDTYYSQGRMSSYRNKQQQTLKNEIFYIENIFSENFKITERNYWKSQLQENIENKIDIDDKIALSDKVRGFLNDEFALFYSNGNDPTYSNERNNQPYSSFSTLPLPVNLSKSQQANIELLRIFSTAYKTIYSRNQNQKLSSNNQSHNISLLDIFAPLLHNWTIAFGDLLQPSDVCEPINLNNRNNKRVVKEFNKIIEGESLICDYNYCQLYIFSLALQIGLDGEILTVNEITKSSTYINLAYQSAKEYILSTERVFTLKMLKYMPVRWLTRLIRATAFLVKCYLSVAGTDQELNSISEINMIFKLGGTSANEVLELIKKSAILLGSSSPDELHLCSRYSSIIMCFYKEMSEKNLTRKRGSTDKHNAIEELNKIRQHKKQKLLQKEYKKKTYKKRVSSDTIRTKTNNFNQINLTRTTKGRPEVALDTEAQASHRKNLQTQTAADESALSTSPSISEVGSKNSNQSLMQLTSQIEVGTSSDLGPTNRDLLSYNTRETSPNTGHTGVTGEPTGSHANEFLDWFSASGDIGLEFVESWTEMLEQRYMKDDDNLLFNN